MEQAEEAQANPVSRDGPDEKLVNIDVESKTTSTSENSNSIVKDSDKKEFCDRSAADNDLEKFFGDLIMAEGDRSSGMQARQMELEKSLTELDLAMDSFTGGGSVFDFNKATSLAGQNPLEQNQPSLQDLTSENVALLEDILNSGPSANTEWDSIASDTFLPPGILKQSLGDAILGAGKERPLHQAVTEKVSHSLFLKKRGPC